MRTIVEVEADVAVRGEVEAERGERRKTDVGRTLLGVRRVERRQPTQVAHVRRGGLLIAVRTQQEREPALAPADEGSFDLVARGLQHGLQLAQRDLLFLVVPRDRIGLLFLHEELGVGDRMKAGDVPELRRHRAGAL